MSYPDPELITALESAGCTVRGTSVVCGFHEDHHASGSIYQGNDGKWRYKCHGCDAAGDAVDIIARHTGRPLSEVLKGRENHLPTASRNRPQPREKRRQSFERIEDLAESIYQQTPEAIYRYTDSEARYFLAVIRLPGKEFRQARWNGHAWESGGISGPFPLYGQVRLAADRSSVVVITEGEKDVDTLAHFGLLATTVPMGADAITCPLSNDGKPGKVDCSPLAGRNVVLWGDDDEPGRNHMVRVARCLARLNPPPTVRIIRDEDRQGCKDAAELLDKIGEAAARLTINQAIPFTLTLQPIPFDLMTFAKTPKGQLSWVWQGVIPVGMLSLVAGKQGLGKSYMLCDIAARVSTGNIMPDGMPSPPANVLLLAREDDASLVLKPRLESAGADLSRIHWPTFSNKDTHAPMDLTQHINSLTDVVKVHIFRLIVVDTFSAFAPIGTDANAAQSVRGVLDPLAQLAKKTGAAVVLVAHVRKAGQGEGEAMDAVSGSAQMTAGVRVASILEQGQGEGERWFHTVKSNLGPANGNGWTFRFQSTTANLVPSSVPKIEWTIAGEAYRDAQADRRAGRVPVDSEQVRNALLSAVGKRPITLVMANQKVWTALRRLIIGIKKTDVEIAIDDLIAEDSSCFEIGSGQKGAKLIGLPGKLPETPDVRARRLATKGMTVQELMNEAGCRKATASEILRELNNGSQVSVPCSISDGNQGTTDEP